MTLKHRKKHKNNTQKCKKYAKNGAKLNSKLKSCRAKMYQSVYGVSSGGSIRSPSLQFY